LVAKERLRLIQAQIDRVKENLSDTQKLLEQGFTDEYTVMQLEVQLSNLEPQLIQAQYGVKQAHQNLLDAMGLPVQLNIDTKGDLSKFEVQ
ncbi:MAG: TolC family protein, partial [Aliifodinibius sp.]|nr:TolC family protein [Fodinibius sp.]NIV15156.1 TolC family protein [Fodinibius sp.]NIY29001.1 TolC family protein [Fodinibius sp.]